MLDGSSHNATCANSSCGDPIRDFARLVRHEDVSGVVSIIACATFASKHASRLLLQRTQCDKQELDHDGHRNNYFMILL